MTDQEKNEFEVSVSGAGDLQGSKASSLTEDAAARRTVRRRKKRRSRRRSSGAGLMVDLLLLIVLAALAVGGVLGYNAIRDAYAPTFETRQIVIIVEMAEVDPTLIPGQSDVGKNTPIYRSERADATPLGRVESFDVSDHTSDDAPNENDATVIKKNIRITVRAEAKYRAGEGYYIDGERLLAGDEATYRLSGMVADGMIVSLYEAKDYDAMIESAEDGK